VRPWKRLLAPILLLVLAAPAPAGERLKLATPTSADNSGLLKILLPPFEKKEKVKVDVIAVGSGKALALARNGDVDLILVHDPAAEKDFLASGHGVRPTAIMRNHFVIMGPKDDPAGIRGSRNAAAAFSLIHLKQAAFVSRGDSSGTHSREMAIWSAAGLPSGGRGRIETGQGMGATLKIADEKQAYVLSDEATHLSYRDKLDLKILHGKREPLLANPYTAIAVNPDNHPHVDHERALKLIEWMASPSGQRLIGQFKVGGKRLFVPAGAAVVRHGR